MDLAYFMNQFEVFVYK
jgi:hypothetical protein